MINSLEDAMNFFLSNSSGSCIGVRPDGTEKELTCYPEAIEFFND